MKFTEGGFRQWGYDLAEEEYAGKVVKEGEDATGKVIINDRIADAMFQELLMRPEQYSVVATTTLTVTTFPMPLPLRLAVSVLLRA